jgi:hypothetical protein
MKLLFLSIIASVCIILAKGAWKNPITSVSRIEVKNSVKLDADAMRRIGASKFPIKPSSLIALAEKFLEAEFNDESLLADNFVFQFPIVGPLSKAEFLKAFSSFELKSIFPDAQGGICDFRIDPFEPNRVWCWSYFHGTNNVDSKVAGKATNKELMTPPQILSVVFNEQGKVIKFTGGYVVDKDWGNTGGLGGVFGLFYGIGKPLPFPEARPWQPSWQFRLFNSISSILQKFQK